VTTRARAPPPGGPLAAGPATRSCAPRRSGRRPRRPPPPRQAAAGTSARPDFFDDRVSAEYPPYAVRTLPRGKRDIAVWCTKDLAKPHSEREYSLLVRVDDRKNPLAHCPKRIDGIKFIGGLTFRVVNESANWYSFIASRRTVGTRVVSPQRRFRAACVPSIIRPDVRRQRRERPSRRGTWRIVSTALPVLHRPGEFRVKGRQPGPESTAAARGGYHQQLLPIPRVCQITNSQKQQGLRRTSPKPLSFVVAEARNHLQAKRLDSAQKQRHPGGYHHQQGQPPQQGLRQAPGQPHADPVGHDGYRHGTQSQPQ
jgi:hypothetical protein